MSTNTIHALKDKRSETAGQVLDLEKRLAEARGNLLHIDACLRLFGWNEPLETIKPKKVTTRSLFGRNELQRIVLDQMRLQPRHPYTIYLWLDAPIERRDIAATGRKLIGQMADGGCRCAAERRMDAECFRENCRHLGGANERGVVEGGPRKRRNVSYRDLVEKLAELGVSETEQNIRTKISRGGFSAAFLIQCLDAIGSRDLRLD